MCIVPRPQQSLFLRPRTLAMVGSWCTSWANLSTFSPISLFHSDCPIQMMGDHLELHKIGEHPHGRRVHLQGDWVPLHGARPSVVQTLLTLDGKVVRKLGTVAVNQYLKVLVECPTMIGCPYDLRPSRANILLVDNNPSKNILNPTSNYILCPCGRSRRSKIGFWWTLWGTFKCL